MIVEEVSWRRPADVAAAFCGEPHAHLLSAGDRASPRGAAIFVADPRSVFTIREGRARLDGAPVAGDPVAALAQLIESRARRSPTGAAPFASGVLGFVGYDAAALFEPTLSAPPAPGRLPDAVFGVYEAAMVFDLDAQRCRIAASSAAAAAAIAERIRAREAMARAPSAMRLVSPPIPSMSREAFERGVARVREDILAGDYFQANLAYHLTARIEGGALSALYSALTAQATARLCAFLQYPEGTILSVSPERFFAVRPEGEGRRIRAEPIKGTRPRGGSAEEDEAYRLALLNDEKDRAENIMIADLLRNDLSRVCDDRSIREDAICALESHAGVHHLVSRISGNLNPGAGATDALAALFPCGSITGAPKPAAMGAIACLEGRGRGPYTGAIGYIDDGGGADFSVAIRTVVAEPDGGGWTLSYGVGAGVTALSDPLAEYEETLVKARPFLDALAGLEQPGGRAS